MEITTAQLEVIKAICGEQVIVMPIPNITGWFATDCGRVFSIVKSNQNNLVREVKGTKHRRGYLRSMARQHNKCYLLHRLIASAFFGPAPADKQDVLHINDIPNDNRIINLKYGNKVDNAKDMYRLGTLGKKLTKEQVSEILAYHRAKIFDIKQLADKYGVTWRNIKFIVDGVIWKDVQPKKLPAGFKKYVKRNKGINPVLKTGVVIDNITIQE